MSMRFHFLLTNHYPYGLYKIEDHIRLISAGLMELGHDVTYGFDDDVAPWPALNLLVEFFNNSAVVDQVLALKRRAAPRYAFGLVCHEDLQDSSVMDDPAFPNRRAGLEQLLPHMDFAWTAVPSDYSTLEGGARMRWLEYGYARSLRRPNVMQRDIDVLFYSSLGDRREPLFHALRQCGVRTSATFGMLPGYVKNDLLDRARVVVDVARSETVRFLAPTTICSALHAGALVVTERFDKGPLSSLYRYTVETEWSQLLELCTGLARRPESLEVAAAARELFASNTSMAANLRRAMDLPVFAEAAAA